MIADLAEYGLGLLQGGVGRQHGLHEKDALVLLGQIGGGHLPEENPHGRHDHQEHEEIAHLLMQRVADRLQVEVAGFVEQAVEPSEKRPHEKDGVVGGLVTGRHRL